MTSDMLMLWVSASAGIVAFVAMIAFVVALFRLQNERAASSLKVATAEERARAAETAAATVDQVRNERDRLIGQNAEHRAAAAAEAARAVELVAGAQRLAAERGELAARLEDTTRALERLQTEKEARERQIEELKAAGEMMRRDFAESAGALMQKNSETFKAQNKEQIETLLSPLKTDIEAFKKSLGEAHARVDQQHGALRQQIEQLSLRSAEVSKETIALTRALKGDVQVQGAWGEMVLDSLLQRLGFEEGVQYTRQETFADAEGRVRTDFVVRLPNNDPLIIDSKVSLTDFEAFVNANDDAERAARLAAHARSMRQHVKGLAARNYPKKARSRLDFVVMFVPIEGALPPALMEDEQLCLDALDMGVVIATPTTLATQLRTVSAVWRIERQQKNAEDIAQRAGQLYDKFVNFIDDMQGIGQRLSQLDAAYQGAMKKLGTGSGNLVRQAEMLRELGAASTKQLSRDCVEAAGVDASPVLLPPQSSDYGADATRAAE